MRRLSQLIAALCLCLPPGGSAKAAELSRQAVNAAQFVQAFETAEGQSPLVLKVQILLDRAGASPGVLDGYYGENVAKAISTFETMRGLTVDGKLDAEVWAALAGAAAAPVLVEYQVTEGDVGTEFVARIPDDYAKMAEMERLGYTSLEEMLSERFHMDIDLLIGLNSGANWSAGSKLIVADVRGSQLEGEVARIEADKAKAQLRAYDRGGKLLAAYPATIGSSENPSPSGTHEVRAIAFDPAYYYQPDVNFQQGDNTEALKIPPGPNNPVGSVWIDLSEPTYGIHGTPEPAAIDKTASHGCVRLTNWDAEELAKLVEPGVTVEFLE